MNWVQIPTPLLAGCVTLSKLLDPSGHLVSKGTPCLTMEGGDSLLRLATFWVGPQAPLHVLPGDPRCSSLLSEGTTVSLLTPLPSCPPEPGTGPAAGGRGLLAEDAAPGPDRG